MKFSFGILLALFFPVFLFAQEISSRTGFVDGSVWFSDESISLGETIKIHTAVFNGEDSRLTLKVDFIDTTTVLSTKEISLSPNETKTVSADWKASSGSHEIYAQISYSSVDGKQIILNRDKTETVTFSVTKEVPGNVVKKALIGKFSSVFEGEGSFTEKADSWFKLNFKKSEEFREKTLEKIEKSKSLVEKKRKENKDEKTFVKIITFVHFYSLVVLKYIFSVSIIFYITAVILLYMALRILWRILRRIFRKKHEED